MVDRDDGVRADDVIERKQEPGPRRSWPGVAAGSVRSLLGICLVLHAGGGLAPLEAQAPENASQLVEHALDLMGGDSALRGIETVRLNMVTQWQRTQFRDLPGTDRPSYEPHVDVRDYRIRAWRNTREFGRRYIVNIIRDSVATTDFGQGVVPQSVAYVDERDELFVYTPDRLILLLQDAPDLRSGPDTTMGGERFRTVRATVEGGLPVSVAFHAGTGLPALLHFTAGHPNDFGLVPWDVMDVDVWYSAWNTFGEISIPTQWDVLRVGRPYKRLTVGSATFNPEFEADSFSISPELRQAFIDARAPMHDRAIDSVSVVKPGLLQIHGFGFPAGALRLGGEWIILEAGHAPLSLARGREALAGQGMSGPFAAVVVAARAGNGGVVSLVDEGVPVHTSPAGDLYIRAMLENAGRAYRGIEVARQGSWLERNGERLRLEPIDLPDVPGSLMVYVPSLEWVYAPDAVTALDRRIILEHALELGWAVSAVGTARAFWREIDP